MTLTRPKGFLYHSPYRRVASQPSRIPKGTGEDPRTLRRSPVCSCTPASTLLDYGGARIGLGSGRSGGGHRPRIRPESGVRIDLGSGRKSSMFGCSTNGVGTKMPWARPRPGSISICAKNCGHARKHATSYVQDPAHKMWGACFWRVDGPFGVDFGSPGGGERPECVVVPRVCLRPEVPDQPRRSL